MVEIDDELQSGALTAVVAALGDQKELLEFRDKDRSPHLELEELKDELDQDISNEVSYLRDSGIVSTEVFQDETVEVKLNPDLTPQASEMKKLMYNEFDGSLKSLAHSDEYMDFDHVEWARWEGPEQNNFVTGSVDYGKNMGSLCAIMSLYGEERLKGAGITEYSVDALQERFSLEDYELEFNLENRLETLELLGYVEKHHTGLNDVYRLAGDEEVKVDAEMIAEHRNDVFSGYPQNMVLAYEEADRMELAEKGVKLVQRPGKQAQ